MNAIRTASAGVKIVAQTVAVFVMMVAASAVVVAVSPGPDLTPNFSLELMNQPVDVTSVASDQIMPAATSREAALGTAQMIFDKPNASYRIYRAISRKFVTSEDRDVWVVVFEGGNPLFAGPERPNAAPSVVRLTGLIIDAQTGEFLRGFMEGG